MFNDLTGDQNKNSAGAVDDIFAETDNNLETPKTSNPANAQIETRQVGLSAVPGKEGMASSPAVDMLDEDDPAPRGGKGLKMAIIVVLVLVVALGGYLAYSKFMAQNNDVDLNGMIAQTPVANEDNNTAPVAPVEDDSFVSPVSENEDASDFAEEEEGEEEEEFIIVTDPKLVDSDLDTLSDYDEVNVYKTNPNLVDSDFDGLNDYEEVMTYNTDPNLADTDRDGLSDYEEIKVHGTDPLKADTDGDGFNDGEELKNGYNPLGDGRLPGF